MQGIEGGRQGSGGLQRGCDRLLVGDVSGRLIGDEIPQANQKQPSRNPVLWAE